MDVTEEGIDSYLTGSRNSTIRAYFDDQMKLYLQQRETCEQVIKHRWIRNMIFVYNELLWIEADKDWEYRSILWSEIEPTFVARENGERQRYDYLRPDIPYYIDVDSEEAGKGEGAAHLHVSQVSVELRDAVMKAAIQPMAKEKHPCAVGVHTTVAAREGAITCRECDGTDHKDRIMNNDGERTQDITCVEVVPTMEDYVILRWSWREKSATEPEATKTLGLLRISRHS